MVRDLVHWLSYNGIHDGYVPSPELVQVVTLSVSGVTLSECMGKSRSYHLLVNLSHLPVQVTSYDDLGLGILPDDALDKADDCLCPLHYEYTKTPKSHLFRVTHDNLNERPLLAAGPHFPLLRHRECVLGTAPPCASSHAPPSYLHSHPGDTSFS